MLESIFSRSSYGFIVYFMTVTVILAYISLACYFAIERSLRKGQQALSINPGEPDAGSSKLLWLGGTIGMLIIIAAPILNMYQIGYWNNPIVGWLGLGLMLSGLALRYWAAKTLGECYTRTLQVIPHQKIIDRTPYNVIRHPGYLGTFLMEIGGGLAVTNWLALFVLLAIGSTVRAYRIRAEEKMLEANFGEEYKDYSSRTWKLIPFLY